jgi:Fic family protein
LIQDWKITEIAKWIYKKKENIIDYLNKPFFDREPKSYNFDFLWSYIPNETSFLWEKFSLIKTRYLDKNILSSYDYKQNLRAIENLLIDLSFSSSKLEGNTYSYLDTEILIKYNNSAEWKTQVETQMILNHKNAIKYIIDNKSEIKLSKEDFQNIHIFLWKALLLNSHLWKIRNSEVTIWGSSYSPLDNKFQLEEQFELFLEKLNAIQNPFEQSLFILVFIPYFQIFIDINKRTSRICSNIPLIKKWLIPFSFLQIQDRDYINAVLAIYELNDTSLMRDLFVNNYLLNMKRYS